MSPVLKGIGYTTAILAIVIALVYRTLISSPEAAVKGYKLLNFFTNEIDFNLNENQYVTGPFAPVQEENFNVATEILSGTIPKDLEGLFLRIGPNPLPQKLQHGYHWFDGDGMIHSFRVKDGKAVYSNQFIATPNYRLSNKYKEAVWYQIGELKGVIGLLKIFYSQLILAKSLSLTPLDSGTANTAITLYNHCILVGLEANLPFEIAWQETGSFVSIGYEAFNHTLDYPFTAHPKKDPEDDHLYFHGYNPANESTLKYGKIKGNRVESYFSLPFKDPIFSHDMSITKNYVVLFDSSIVFDEKEIFGDGAFFKMNKNKFFRIGLIPKSATNANDLRWFSFDSSYGIVHAFNAWEEPETNEVVVVAPLYTEFGTFTGNDLTKQQLEYRTAELRINLHTSETKIIYFKENNEGGEFPNVHPDYVGRRSKFGFASGINRTSYHFDRIVKYEFYPSLSEAGTIFLPKDYVFGEAVVIPRNHDREKGDYSDNVYLGLFAIHARTLESHWLVYDGKTMSEEPVVKIKVPGKRIPLGFHGYWIGEKDLQDHLNHKTNPN